MAIESMETTGTSVLEQLERDGLAVLPGFIAGKRLADMQRAFQSRLGRLRWNDFDGYEKTERFRHMVQDVLTLDQGFLDVAIDPLVKETLKSYVGPNFELVEAKGWKSLPTRRMFHGWHADAWYDPSKTSGIAREVKLAFYLSDVVTGSFSYIKGTHRQHHPRMWKNHEIEAFDASRVVYVPGKAGTAFLFDTSGVHGQSSPILEPRHAVFYNYHDPAVPLQKEDLDYYRYHPLLLNAAFLGNLSVEDCRILGFGNKAGFVPAFERKPRHPRFQAWHSGALAAKIVAEEYGSRVRGRIRRLLGA